MTSASWLVGWFLDMLTLFRLFYAKVSFSSIKLWLIDFNGMSTHLGSFHAQRFRNCVHCTSQSGLESNGNGGILHYLQGSINTFSMFVYFPVHWLLIAYIYPTPSPGTGYDTRSIFKKCLKLLFLDFPSRDYCPSLFFLNLFNAQ